MKFDGFKSRFLFNLEKLTNGDKKLFERIYHVQATTGRLDPPEDMYEWIKNYFGSVRVVKKQNFLKITNKITYEGAIFNDLRTRRPIVGDKNIKDVMDAIDAAKNGPFSKPLKLTPADTFGRIKGKYCVTASNVAKYDGLHGLIIFNDHNPLLFSRRRVRDYFDVAKKWFEAAHKSNEKAIYPLYTWNCLWKAASSVIHGHNQIALTEGMAYAKIENLRSLTLRYQEQFRSNYFEDDYYLHKKLGLAFQKKNIKVQARITPTKEKELRIIASECNDNLADFVSDILNVYKESLGVVSFNMIMILPPMAECYETWDHMPVVINIVDRGKLTTKTADFGAMELYAQSIVGSSPYTVIKDLKKVI